MVQTLKPGKAVLHMEFTPRGEAVWISARDDDRVVVYDTATFARLAELPAQSPSGIFFTWRAPDDGIVNAAFEFSLLNDFQRDFPLVRQPFTAIGETVGATEAQVLRPCANCRRGAR